MHETMAFDLAVKTAFELTDAAETLIIVTADHGHTMTMAGYQTRGSDIRGQFNFVLKFFLKLKYFNLRSFYMNSDFCVAPCRAMPQDQIKTDPKCMLHDTKIIVRVNRP
jgi:hypothetical protein